MNQSINPFLSGSTLHLQVSNVLKGVSFKASTLCRAQAVKARKRRDVSLFKRPLHISGVNQSPLGLRLGDSGCQSLAAVLMSPLKSVPLGEAQETRVN